MRVRADGDHRGRGDAGQVRRARRMAKTLGAAGWQADFVEGPDLGLPAAFLGGVRERIGGLLNPGMYALGVRAALLASPASVFEQTPVQAVDEDSGGATITSEGGRVRRRARRARHERVLPGPHDRAAAPRDATVGHVGGDRAVAPDRLEEIGWAGAVGRHAGHPARELPADGAEHVVLGTRRVQTTRGRFQARQPDAAVVDDLVRGFHERFPIWATWPATGMGRMDRDDAAWLPVAGEAGPRVIYGIGCNGHGTGPGAYLGTLIADRLAGDDLHDDLRAVWRKRPRFAPGVLSSAPAVRAAWIVDRVADRRQRRG